MLLLISEASLEGVKLNAPTRQDNMLTEWEQALERRRQGDAVVLPIFIDSVKISPDVLADFPAAPHFLTKKDIRGTVRVELARGGK